MSNELPSNGEYALLVYDIPTGKGIPSPASMLRHRAVRINLSVWAIPLARVPYGVLDGLAEQGMDYHVVQFAASEREKVRTLALQGLEQESERLKKSLQDRTASAREAVEKAQPGEDWGKARRHALHVLLQARHGLAAAEEAAVAFELTADTAELVAGIKAAITAEVDAFYGALLLGNEPETVQFEGKEAAE